MKITFFIVFIIYASSIIADSKCNQADLILENASIYDGLSDKSFIGSIGVKAVSYTHLTLPTTTPV